MLTEDDVRRLLLQKTETRNVDYKASCNWTTAANEDKCEIVKDILAMANTQDGGQIVLGVNDDNFEFVGMVEADFQSFDPTRVNDFVRRYSDPIFACNLYKLTIDGQRAVVIEVPEFSEVPILCKTDANSSDQPRRMILKKGGLYVRTDKPSSELVSSAEEMRDIIGRASRKKREELLRTIRDLLEGRTVPPEAQVQRAYAPEVADANTFFTATLSSEFDTQGHWEVTAYPATYVQGRIPDHTRLAELIRNSTVALRGWDFPHSDRENTSNFAAGRQSYTAFLHHTEAYRAFCSGLFCWKGAFWENQRVPDQKVLSFIGAIYQLTEFFQFFKRYYSEIPDLPGIHFEIKLADVRDRTLVSLDPGVDLFGQYSSREAEITLSGDLTMEELQADAEGIARRLAKRAFAIFNWNDVQDSTIGSWQHKLLTRTF